MIFKINNMSADGTFFSNAPEYYRAMADYDGVVAKTAHAIIGLNTENLRKWYLARCSDFFNIESSLHWAKKGKISARDSSARDAMYRRLPYLAFRMTSRLYVTRNVHKIGKELDKYYASQTEHYQRIHKTYYAQALDKNLYLADKLKSFTSHIQSEEEDVLKEARLGSIWMPRHDFNPKKQLYSPFNFGDLLAIIQHFRQLLFQFDLSINQSSSKGKSPSQTDLATIKSGIDLVAVRALLSKIGMGKLYDKPGEWTVALRALAVAGVLRGNGPQVARWAVAEGFVTERSSQTIRKAWDNDGLNQAEQCKNSNQKTVFRAAEKEVGILLKESGLSR